VWKKPNIQKCTSKKVVCQACGLSPYLLNIFINNITEYIDIEGTHTPVINGLRTPGLLVADNLAIYHILQVRGYKRKFN
jgi:hypothetical protein